MISVNIKKGFGLNISGEPSHKVEVLEKPTRVALLPERIPFVKPRLKVKIGDQVKVGTPIFGVYGSHVPTVIGNRESVLLNFAQVLRCQIEILFY